MGDGDPSGQPADRVRPLGLILLHWDGSTWRTVARNRKLRGVTGLTPDGHGGFWFTATNPANPSASDIVRYRDATFTSQPPPGSTAKPVRRAASSQFRAPACWATAC